MAAALKLGPSTKAMLQELAQIVENDPQWPAHSMTTIFFRRRGITDPDKVPIVDLVQHLNGEEVPAQLWFYLPAWEATVQFSSDTEGARTWLIQKLTSLALL